MPRVAAGDDDLAVDQRRGTLQLVAGEENGDAGRRRVPDETVEEVAPGSVEPSVGLVEEPEPGVTDEQGSDGGAAALPGRQPADGDVADPGVDAGAIHGGGRVDATAGGARPETEVLGDGEVVVETAAVPEQPDAAPHGLPVAPEVDAQHGGLAADHGDEAGDRPQQRGLAGAVGTAKKDDLTRLDVEVDAGEGRETAEQADRGAEVDDGVHGDRGKRYRRPRRTSKAAIVGGIGRVLIAFGVLVLLFVAFELWGTGLHEAKAQHRLKKEVAPFVEAARHPPSPTAPTTVPERPVPGDAVALLQIPKIGLEKAVVEGVGVPDLKKAPGHYPQTPLPGQPGNAGIAGHRTTYGAPFWSLDELHAGDQIVVTTRQGRFLYRVDGSEVVKPSNVDVLAPTVGATLTLTTCNPRFSASQRLVVHASLVGTPAPAPPPETEPTPGGTKSGGTTVARDALVGGEHSSAWPAVLWGLLAAVVAFVVRRLARRYHWALYAPGAVVFLLVLFVFFENLANVLPANL